MLSEKQLLANQRNAQRSTGPRTAEGKARSRQNATRHGLAGAGIGLPPEDSALCKERLARWSAELGPRSEVEAFLVERAVVASVRIDRCVHAEFATAQFNRREVIGVFEEQQHQQLSEILNHPEGPVLQRFLALSTGCECVISYWEDIRKELHEQGCLSAEALRMAKFYRTGTQALDLDRLNNQAGGGGEGVEEARRQIDAMIEAEIVQLKARRDEIWAKHEAPQVRQLLEERAFDASPRSMLLRRYETASHNDLHRALRELSRIRRENILNVQDSASAAEPVPAEEADPVPAESVEPAPDAELRNEAISGANLTEVTPCTPHRTPTSLPSDRSARRKEVARRRRKTIEAIEASLAS